MNPSQFIALIRVRFQLTLNQIRKGGAVNSVLFSIALASLVLYVLMSFVMSVVYGAIWLSQASDSSMLLVWNAMVAGFLFLWMFHVMNRVQQNDVISVGKLLHLPITFHGAFLLNYVSSFANLTLLSFAPLFIGLAIAMPFARGGNCAIAIPLSCSFLLMVTAVTHQLQSWLAEKMQNRKTKGILLSILPLMFLAIFLLFSKVTDSYSISDILRDVPLGWLPSGIMAANSGSVLTGIWGTAAMSAIGCASLFFAHRSSMRRFTGEGVAGGASQKAKESTSTAWIDSQLFSSIPFTSNAVSGIALCVLRNIRRTPEVFAALIPAIAMAAFGAPYLIGWDGFAIPFWLEPFLPTLLIAVALLGFPAFLFSTFSYDRDGFRAFILSPVERQDVLLGKNLAIGIPTILIGWLTMIILQCFLPAGFFWFVAGLIQLPAAYFLLCILGNGISTFCPVGLKRGSMTPVNARIIPVIALYLGILVGPFGALLPTSAAFGTCFLIEKSTGTPMGWLFVLLSLVTLAGSWLLYRWTLVELGKGLWNRESDILPIVSNVPE